VAIAPVMAKTKSKCASGLKIIQFFLIFENKSKMSFRFEKKQKKNEKNGKNRNKTKKHRKNKQKNEKKREKQRKKLEVFVIFGFD
jgi:hypothetical protein